ncbi:DUF2510 domain-containing protein [Paenarthrobacter sp. NPDC092416]|uniref:DUF2510 domain-containing protein n=1 Tax=Paenarthrobacter sp. NPDC092416 TaxID=3364386 RepID=UPI003809CFF0
MTDENGRPTTAPGWYADPVDPRYFRWWDGVAWTGHVGPPTWQLMAAQPGPLSKETPVYNSFIWIIACLPFLPAVLLLTWNPEIRFYTSEGINVPDPDSIFTVGYYLIIGGAAFVYGATVLLASLDYKRLVHAGVVRPFHWGWAFLGGVPYVMGRAVTVYKVAPRRGLWPLGVIVAGWVLYYVVGFVKSLDMMQSMFSQMGYSVSA